ncbi:uncharacterized protein PAC_18134 [Phialocephala subalpina]|uniref:Heterokaryon incompatibility domain-containing protein n=1 Tax=Phialocephala subalpina TaxID=576137 RepID=A0A1L7XTA6_9HELO|nr:uncharacterized protein PAC_18134 [Phialocephala subalpina]
MARKALKFVVPPLFLSKIPSACDPILETTIEALRRASNRGCTTCSYLYHALRHTRYCADNAFNDVVVKVWYGNGHFEIGDKQEIFAPGHGTIYQGSGERTTCGLGKFANWLGQLKFCTAFPGVNTIHKHTASTESFEWLEKCIQVCEKRHSCAQPGLSPLPKRVLDVGQGSVGPRKIRRLRLHESEGELGSYIALSHCWGFSPMVTSTKATIHHRRNSIQWEELSKTFQDAVTITRRLGIPYLWIDSLCIIQDDLEDWKEQSSKMLDIYNGAYLTIAADHSKNGEGGCFASSKDKPILMTRISLPDHFTVSPKAFVDWDSDYGLLHLVHNHFVDSNRFAIPLSNLSARGWTLQERLLSRRIIHYTSWELVWECRESRDCQCGKISLMKPKTIMQDFHDSFNSNTQTSNLMELWMNILREYSKRTLTYETDQLVAINGLATYFQKHGLSGYVAGNWKEGMRDMLLWFAFRKRFDRERSPAYVAPSWSWASSRKNVEFIASTWSVRGKRNRRYVARICFVEALGAEGDASGQLVGGHLTVLARTIKLKLACSLPKVEGRQDDGWYQWSQWYLACEKTSTVCLAHPDYESEFETISRYEDEATGLLWDVMPDRIRKEECFDFNDPEWSSHILILQHDPRRPGMYRRIGIGHINWSYFKGPSPDNKIKGRWQSWGLAKDWFKDAEPRMITII